MKKLVLLFCVFVMPLVLAAPTNSYATKSDASASKELHQRLASAKKHHQNDERFEAIRDVLWVLIQAPGGAIEKKAWKFFKQISQGVGVIFFSSEPRGATIVVNGEELTVKTPAIYYDVNPGDYTATLTLKGHKKATAEITVKASDYTVVYKELSSSKGRKRRR